MFKLGKCVIIFCIIFMMSPPHKTRIHGNRYPYPYAPMGPLTMKGIIHDEVRTEENVAGFDLTNEEMIKFKIWPQGVIPYYIDVLSFKDKVLRDRIRGFLNVVNGLTGLNFLELLVPPQDEKKRWVFFINRRGLLDCADHSTMNFTNAGVQHVILGYDCMSTRGELAEAVLAIAGVPPQHNAPNRDEYIRVVEDSIMPEKRYLFEKLNDKEWLFHDIAYDFYSAGHYDSHKYSVNGRATIETKKEIVNIPVGEVEVVKSGNELSNGDILKIKRLYSYISKNKRAHIPECHKLFQAGKHFNNYKPVSSNINAQKKPNKYLGIADDENNVAEDDKKVTGGEADDEADDVAEDDRKDVDDDENDNNDNTNNRSDDNQNTNIENIEEDDKGNQSDNDSESNIGKQGLKNKIKYNSLKDPIKYLSDYKTGDENKQKNVLKGDWI